MSRNKKIHTILRYILDILKKSDMTGEKTAVYKKNQLEKNLVW